MSVFRFFAQTSPGLESILMEELKSFGLRPRIRGDISHVWFQATYSDLFRVLHECRTIESLKIQVGNEIKCRGEDELAKNMQKLPWHAYLPISDMHVYNQPAIHVKSYRSTLYHEKLITLIIERQLNLLQTRKEYKDLSSLSGSRSGIQLINARKKEIEQNKASIIDNRQQLSIKDNADEDSLAKRPSLPDIHAYLVKDRAILLMKLHFDSLHKHSLKEKVGWAPIREGIVAGSLISMNAAEKFAGNSLRVWDPFCGSGSIVLELISMLFESRIRSKFDFSFLKNFPTEEYEAFLSNNDGSNEGEPAKNLPNFSDVSIIASDISNEAIQYSIDNFRYSGLEEKVSQVIKANEQQLEKGSSRRTVSDDDVPDEEQSESKASDTVCTHRLDQLAPFFIQDSFCEKKVRFIRGDFEAISRLVNLSKYTIITNLPFGVRSASHIPHDELLSSFKRFAKILKKNLTKLEDVYVYTTVHLKYHREHFIHMSQMVWRVKQKYTLGGIQIGLFHLDQVASMTCNTYQVIDEVEDKERETRMKYIEASLTTEDSPTKSIMTPRQQQDEDIMKQIREIIGDRAAITNMSPKESHEYNQEHEMTENKRRLAKAAHLIEKPIKEALDMKVHTPRQAKSIVIRKKEEYAKALRLRELMIKDKQVANVNKLELERRVSAKRSRLNKDLLRSVLESVEVEDKEAAMQQIQDKLDQRAELKTTKKEETEKKKKNANSVPKWY